VSFDPWLVDEVAKKDPALLPVRPRRFRFRLVHIMEVVVVVALLCWMAATGLALLLVGSLLLLIASGIGSVVLAYRRWTTQQDALLAVAAIAAEREMPLAPALAAFSEECGIVYRGEVFALAQYLAAGLTLPESLARLPGVFPRDAALLARVGWETGKLPAALRQAAASRSTLRPPWAAISSRIAYFLWVILVIQVIVSFMMYFIIPKFEAIFKDFGVPLPQVTAFVIMASHFLFKFSWVLVPLVLAEVLLLLSWPFSFFGLEYFHVPGIDRLFIRRHTALVLRCLGWVVEAGRPLPWGIELLSRWYPTRWVRVRLERAAVDVAHGQDWTTALARQGLLGPADVALLESSRRAGNLAWALRETAEGGERRLAYRLQIAVDALFPMVVVALGVVVGLIAVSFFTPLVVLIGRLAG
jgi:type II secretory pathway component PulF